ncbi:MAG TPA: hypothetical protein VGE35_00685 [Candidatus Paceibacterota bacterium]
MKIKSVSGIIAWALALIAFTNLNAATTRVVHSSSIISERSPFMSITFQVADAPRGARILIQAKGIEEKGIEGKLDPEIWLFASTRQGLRLICGNDDWRRGWALGDVTTPATVDGVVSYQGITGASTLDRTDAALALLASNGEYTVMVYGWGSSVGLANVSIYEINEAPSAPQISRLFQPVLPVGDGLLMAVRASDPDGDDVEMLYDLDGDGKADFVSTRLAPDTWHWPNFIRFQETGTKVIKIWARDSKGAVSNPVTIQVEVENKPDKG